jgi:spore maturation protein SpmB
MQMIDGFNGAAAAVRLIAPLSGSGFICGMTASDFHSSTPDGSDWPQSA